MTAVLDLAPWERFLADLEETVGAHSIEETLLAAGQRFQGAWRDNILSANLVKSGNYLGSISVDPIDVGPGAVAVQIATDARTAKGEPYPFFLEYGTEFIFPHPVANRAFLTERRDVVQEVSTDIERKIRSRARFPG